MATANARVVAPREFPSPFNRIVADLINDGHHLYASLCHQMIDPWRGRSLQIAFVDDSRLNAVAQRDGDSYAILINRGTIEHLYGTFYSLFAVPTFMPNIGNTSGELDASFQPAPFPLAKLESDALPSCPRDPTRQTIATLFAEIALHFLMYHEIGHIVAGHLDIPPEPTVVPCAMSEFQPSRGTPHDRLSHVLECDADAFACHLSFHIHTASDMANEISGLMQSVGWSPTECALASLLAPVSVLFRMNYPSAPIRVGPPMGQHPHPAVRDFVIGTCAMARGMHKGQVSADSLVPLLEATVFNVEETWCKLHDAKGLQTFGPDWANGVWQGFRSLLDDYSGYASYLSQHTHLPRVWHDWEWASINEVQGKSTAN